MCGCPRPRTRSHTSRRQNGDTRSLCPRDLPSLQRPRLRS
jgi:hypothetical protein